MVDRVLLVDDDAVVRMLVTARLEVDGWEVSTAESVAEGRAALAAGPAPTALVLDDQLPDGSGVELAADAGAETHVVLYSATAVAALPPGVHAVVPKSGPPDALVEHLTGLRPPER